MTGVLTGYAVVSGSTALPTPRGGGLDLPADRQNSRAWGLATYLGGCSGVDCLPRACPAVADGWALPDCPSPSDSSAGSCTLPRGGFVLSRGRSEGQVGGAGRSEWHRGQPSARDGWKWRVNAATLTLRGPPSPEVPSWTEPQGPTEVTRSVNTLPIGFLPCPCLPFPGLCLQGHLPNEPPAPKSSSQPCWRTSSRHSR